MTGTTVSCFSISCAECLSVLSSTDFHDSSTSFVINLLQPHVVVFHFQAVYFLLEDFVVHQFVKTTLCCSRTS